MVQKCDAVTLVQVAGVGGPRAAPSWKRGVVSVGVQACTTLKYVETSVCTNRVGLGALY